MESEGGRGEGGKQREGEREGEEGRQREREGRKRLWSPTVGNPGTILETPGSESSSEKDVDG